MIEYDYIPCDTCDGLGTVCGGWHDCPDCAGTGAVEIEFEIEEE